jgi:hypothetical protein
MESFRREAHFALMRDSGFVIAACAIMMIAFAAQPELAFCIAATIALMFAVTLVFKVDKLTDEEVQRSEPWLSLEWGRRPRGAEGRRWARERFEELLLVFAKRSSGAAVALFAVALVTHVVV